MKSVYCNCLIGNFHRLLAFYNCQIGNFFGIASYNNANEVQTILWFVFFSHFCCQTFTIKIQPLLPKFGQNSAIKIFRPLLSFLVGKSATWQQCSTASISVCGVCVAPLHLSSRRLMHSVQGCQYDKKNGGGHICKLHETKFIFIGFYMYKDQNALIFLHPLGSFMMPLILYHTDGASQV